MGCERSNTRGAWNCNLCGENRQGMILHIHVRGSQWSKWDFKMNKRKCFFHPEHFQMWSSLSRCAVEIRPWRAVSAEFLEYGWLLALSSGFELLLGSQICWMVRARKRCQEKAGSVCIPCSHTSRLFLPAWGWRKNAGLDELCDSYSSYCFLCDLLTWKIRRTNCLFHMMLRCGSPGMFPQLMCCPMVVESWHKAISTGR